MLFPTKRLCLGSLARPTQALSFTRLAFAALLLVGVVGSALPHSARAQASAVGIAPTDSFSLPGNTFGYRFTVAGTQTITGLGLFDFSGDGLAEAHQVGLWNNAGLLVASTTVTNGNSAVVASGSILGNWRDTSITPVALNSGTYYVGAYFGTGSTDRLVYGGAVSTLPGFSYVADAYGAGAGLAFPTSTDGRTVTNGGYFGGTVFTGGASAATPEPGSIALLALGLTAGVPAVGMIARRRGKAA